MESKNSAQLRREADIECDNVCKIIHEIGILQTKRDEIIAQLTQKGNELNVAFKNSQFVERQLSNAKDKERFEFEKQAREKFQGCSKEILLYYMEKNKEQLKQCEDNKEKLMTEPKSLSRDIQEDALNMQLFNIDVEKQYLEMVLKTVYILVI